MIHLNEPTALYRCFNAEGVLLYIGISRDFGTRWKNEAREFDWWPQVKSQTVYWHDSRTEAEDAERDAIKAERPRHNKQHAVPELVAIIPAPAPRPSKVSPRMRWEPEDPATCILTTAGTYTIPVADLLNLPVAMDLMEAARALGISRCRAYEMAKDGDFPCDIQVYGGTKRILLTHMLWALDIKAPFVSPRLGVPAGTALFDRSAA